MRKPPPPPKFRIYLPTGGLWRSVQHKDDLRMGPVQWHIRIQEDDNMPTPYVFMAVRGGRLESLDLPNLIPLEMRGEDSLEDS
jgi:hypothetical protein